MKIKNLFKSIFILIGMFILLLLMSNCCSLFVKNEYICLVISYLVTCIILFAIFRKDLKFKKFDKRFFKYLGLFVLCYFITIIINSIIYSFVDVQNSTQSINEAFIFKHSFLAIIIMVILGPFFEEVLFRLNFNNAFKSNILFILITGVIFGISHLIGASNIIEYIYIIPYSVMGIYLSYIYRDSDNIYISYFFHSLNNLIILVLLLVIGR